MKNYQGSHAIGAFPTDDVITSVIVNQNQQTIKFATKIDSLFAQILSQDKAGNSQKE